MGFFSEIIKSACFCRDSTFKPNEVEKLWERSAVCYVTSFSLKFNPPSIGEVESRAGHNDGK